MRRVLLILRIRLLGSLIELNHRVFCRLCNAQERTLARAYRHMVSRHRAPRRPPPKPPHLHIEAPTDTAVVEQLLRQVER